ncbi:MAG: hypothetical protein KAG28_03505 [Cocleimonas sp.]|nr:hypothetical protein [Cocleimonas sp.]
MLKIITLTVAVTLLTSACDDGADKITIKHGQFKDSNTSGVHYISGVEQGVTGDDGGFTYESGKTVRFSVGKVVLGSAIGKSIITPVDLVPSGNFNSIKVQNIVRFLMMLDEDTNPATGISISKSVQTVAKTWSPVDFGSQKFAENLTEIIADVTSVEERVHPLPTAAAAKAHLKATFLCAYSGLYKGSFSGGDRGNFGTLVNALTGRVSSFAFSVPNQKMITANSKQSIGFETGMSFTTETSEAGFIFKGLFSSTDALKGDWNRSNLKGNFSAQRIGSDNKARYRFSAQYKGSNNDIGMLSFDIDALNKVRGVRYSMPRNKTLNLSGVLLKKKLVATLSDGSTITGNLDITTGKLNGVWTDNNKGLFGTFDGTGCKLN